MTKFMTFKNGVTWFRNIKEVACFVILKGTTQHMFMDGTNYISGKMLDSGDSEEYLLDQKCCPHGAYRTLNLLNYEGCGRSPEEAT